MVDGHRCLWCCDRFRPGVPAGMGVGELPDLPQRGARLGKPGLLMPGVGGQWVDVEPHEYPGRSRALGGPHRVVTQYLGVAGLE